MGETRRYAVIDSTTREVLNVALWDGESAWSPGVGRYLQAIETGEVVDRGYVHENGAFVVGETSLAIAKQQAIASLAAAELRAIVAERIEERVAGIEAATSLEEVAAAKDG
jgi:hypothetical protein